MKKLVYVVIALQFILLGSIAAKREGIHLFGEQIQLRTAPVDPRDIFRGDYVTLRYDIEQWISAQVKGLKLKKADVFYVQLENDEQGFAQPVALSTEQPDGLFIKGRATNNYGNFKLGIERYYVEQGQGIEIENIQGRGNSWQRALIITAAVGTDGTTVLKGHHFSDITTQLTMVQEANRDEGQNAILTWTIKNESTRTLNYQDSDEHCAVKVWRNDSLAFEQWQQDPCDNAVWQNKQLAAGEQITIELDFNQSRWLLNNGKSLIEGDNNWQGYRLVWQPVGENDLGRLQSNRFRATGRVD